MSGPTITEWEEADPITWRRQVGCFRFEVEVCAGRACCEVRLDIDGPFLVEERHENVDPDEAMRLCDKAARAAGIAVPETNPVQSAAALIATIGPEPVLAALGIPPAAGLALARILAQGGARLGVPALESHPARSAVCHLDAVVRHGRRALAHLEGAAIDRDSGEPHAVCALGRAALAVVRLEGKRG